LHYDFDDFASLCLIISKHVRRRKKCAAHLMCAASSFDSNFCFGGGTCSELHPRWAQRVQNANYCYPILIKIVIRREMLAELPGIKFYENPFDSSRVLYVRTEGQTNIGKDVVLWAGGEGGCYCSRIGRGCRMCLSSVLSKIIMY
jgi:hypothetical protein